MKLSVNGQGHQRTCDAGLATATQLVALRSLAQKIIYHPIGCQEIIYVNSTMSEM